MPVALPSLLSRLMGLAPFSLPSGPVAASCETLCAHEQSRARARPVAAPPADFPSIAVMLRPTRRHYKRSRTQQDAAGRVVHLVRRRLNGRGARALAAVGEREADAGEAVDLARHARPGVGRSAAADGDLGAARD